MNIPAAADIRADVSGDPGLPARVLRKLTWHLLPFLVLLYIFNILDRANVGFARLTMQPDLGMGNAAFDIGYGIFYLGYLLFEVPANLLLERVGARRWIARIMISWGLVSIATMAVTGPWSFYIVRILLGVAEAGFFPGIILYLTYWFPARERARVLALFMAAIPLSGVVTNPLSGAILEYLHGAAGLKGWQWLFLLEGIPSVVLGCVVLFCLTDRPAQARWLTAAERTWLTERLGEEDQYRQRRHGRSSLRALLDGRVWLLICVYFTVAVGANAAGSYFPKLINERFGGTPRAPAVTSAVGSLGSPLGDGPLLAAAALLPGVPSKFVIGLLAALPHLCAAVGMILLGAHSDRTGERRGHVAFAAFVAAGGWALAQLAGSPWLALAGLCLAQTGMMSMLPCFWALPTSFLSGTAAAGGIALINSVANIGGLVGPRVLGYFGLWAMTLTLATGGVLVLWVRHDPRLDQGIPEEKSV